MINPVTGFFEIVQMGEKTSDVIANWLEIRWLSLSLDIPGLQKLLVVNRNKISLFLLWYDLTTGM